MTTEVHSDNLIDEEITYNPADHIVIETRSVKRKEADISANLLICHRLELGESGVQLDGVLVFYRYGERDSRWSGHKTWPDLASAREFANDQWTLLRAWVKTKEIEDSA